MVKRILSMVIIIALLLAGSGNLYLYAADKAIPTEVKKAVKMGIVPNGWTQDLSARVTYSQMASLILTTLSKKGIAINPVTKAWVSSAVKQKSNITRSQAASIIYRCALENYYGVKNAQDISKYDGFEYAVTTDEYHNKCGEALPFMEHRLLSQKRKVPSFDLWSCVYVSIQIDLDNKLPIMEVNKSNYLRVDEYITRQEALVAAKRLYNAFIPVNDVLVSKAPVKILKLSDEELKKAKTMPDASWDNLPQWRGNSQEFVYKRDRFITKTIPESSFYTLNHFGFNFMRVMVGDLFYYKDDGSFVVSQGCLDDLDNAIRYGIEYGVHICICLADLKGFAGASQDISGYTDSKQLKNAQDAYHLLAQRYKNVPNSVLSFNLFNEPWGLDAEDEETYVKAVRVVSSAIRKESPERLIFVDGLSGSQKPVYSLVGDKVAQSLHMYGPDHFMTVGWIPNNSWYVGQQWPLPYVNGQMNHDSSIILRGNFVKSTELKLLCVYCSENAKGTLTIFSDGKVSQSSKIAGESKDNVTKILSFKLQSGAKELKILWEDDDKNTNDVIQLESIAVISPEKTAKGTPYVSSPWMGSLQSVRKMINQKITVISCDYTGNNYGVFSPEQTTNPTINISEDGSYTSKSESGFQYIYDKQYFRDYLKPWVEFSKATGVKFAVLEWGPYAIDTIPAQSSYDYTKDAAGALAEYKLPWCYWAKFLDTGRLDIDYEVYG